MAKCAILLSLLVVGGFAFPASEDDGAGFDEDMSIFFDHTAADIEGRIVGGSTAAAGAHPWMVAMTNGRNRNFLCGGSVATVRHVLTAAHCIRAVLTGSTLSSTLGVTVGTNRWSTGGQTYSLQRHVNHPQYHQGNIKNDIGILFTASNIVLNNAVRVIPMNYNHIAGGSQARVAGWGRTATGGALSANLMELSTTVINGQTCVTEVARRSRELNMRAPHVDPAIEICTYLALNRGTCNGDSGSALVLNSNRQQIGIVSWGLPCARGAPDMFVRISAYRSWIETNMR